MKLPHADPDVMPASNGSVYVQALTVPREAMRGEEQGAHHVRRGKHLDAGSSAEAPTPSSRRTSTAAPRSRPRQQEAPARSCAQRRRARSDRLVPVHGFEP